MATLVLSAKFTIMPHPQFSGGVIAANSRQARIEKNISALNPTFQALIRDIAARFPVGIHPSYWANEKQKRLISEKNRLEKIIEKPVVRSRQHFLKLRFPETYRQLLAARIEEDWSLGYADDTGFRASVATPFYWFDVEKNEKTTLKVHSFQAMDVTLKNYLHLSPTEAVAHVRALSDATRTVGGTFSTLWHNDNLSDEGDWKGWRDVYEAVLDSTK